MCTHIYLVYIELTSPRDVQACVPAAQQLLAACRVAGVTVVHTKEAHLPDLSDLHTSKATRGKLPKGLCIGDKGDMGRLLVREEPGNDIIPEVAPVEVRRVGAGGGETEVEEGGWGGRQEELAENCVDGGQGPGGGGGGSCL